MDSISAVSSVAATSAGISALFKTLSAESPQFAAILATPKLKSALDTASPSDVVELSAQALQLQQVGVLFGNSDSTSAAGTSSSDSLLSLLSPNSSDAADLISQTLQNSADGGATAALASASQAAAQPDLASFLTSSQSSQIATLFSLPSSNQSTFSVFG